MAKISADEYFLCVGYIQFDDELRMHCCVAFHYILYVVEIWLARSNDLMVMGEILHLFVAKVRLL